MFALPEEGLQWFVVNLAPWRVVFGLRSSVFGWPGELEEGSDG